MKYFTLLITLFFAVTVNAQKFPGKHPELLIGKEVKIKPTDVYSGTGFYGFYHKKDLVDFYGGNHSIPYNDFIGRTFRVEDITPITKFSDPVKSIKLVSPDGEVLYYKYDGIDANFYPFEVIGDIEIPKEVYCEYVTEVKQPEYSSYRTEKVEGIDLYKSTQLKLYTFNIFMFGTRHTVEPLGIRLYLDNNIVIDKPDELITAVHHDSATSRYSTRLELSQKEFELLAKHKVLKVKINQIEKKIDNGDMIRGLAQCLLNNSSKN